MRLKIYSRRGVEKVDAKPKGLANRGDGVILRNKTEDVAERRGSEADATELEAGGAEITELQLRHW